MKNILRLISLLIVSSALGDKPNLLVIMCDDLGYSDVGFNGCKDIPTPHIDRIANEGVTFTNAYVSYSVCGPSRAGFLTGRYGQRFGFERNPQYDPSDPNMGLPKSESNIAEVLQPVGYSSGIIGKWHMGANKEAHHPLNRGFKEFFGHLGGGHRFFPEDLTIKDSYTAKGENESYRTWIMRDHEPVQITKYLTDEFSDEAVQFIGRNKDNPWFLFLSYNAPHLPLQATQEYLDRFPNLTGKRKIYAAMVSAVDDGVGRILKKLEEDGLDENTMIFFLSDNGGPYKKNASENKPLKGGKSDVWEGGMRVPYALKWKGVLPAGTQYDKPVSSLDILGTIADISKAPIKKGKELDGVNLIPYVLGEKEGVPHKNIYMRKFDQQRYVIRNGDFKYVVPAKNVKPHLYNLAQDVGETKNISAENPEKMMELEKQLNNWTNTLQDPVFLGLVQSAEWQKNKAKNKK